MLLVIKFNESFQENRDYQSRKFANDWQFLAMKSPFYLHTQPDLSQKTGFSVRMAHNYLVYAVFSILEALKRLKVICMKSASIAFLSILGNLARLALLYKWFNPKYCSTMYRNLEIALLHSFSYSVSSVPFVALRFVPSYSCLRISGLVFQNVLYPRILFLTGSSVCVTFRL